MKRITPLYMMLVFALSAVWTGVQSYQIAQREIASQLTEALLLTKMENPQDWFSPDTIRQFRGHIRQTELRSSCSLAFYADDRHEQPRGLCGRDVGIAPSLRARGYVQYSTLQVWRMSDRRLSFAFGLMALCCMALSLRARRWTRAGLPALAPEALVPTTHGGLPTHLTPMQERLVAMLLASPRGELTKQEICDTLWPGKPDASETLYTLIRRTKQALGEASGLSIESNRGRSYRLTRR